MASPESSPTETRRFMAVFSAASFLNDFGSDMLYPIWPLFVIGFPGVNMAILGFIDGLGDAIVSISQAGSGYLSDKIGKRKVFVWLGYLFGGTSRLGYALSRVISAWQYLIPFRVLDRSGKMRGAPRDAIIADVSTNQNRGRNFGLLRAMDNLGAVFGIVTCLILVSLYGLEFLPNLLLIASVPSLIGATLVFVFIKDRKTNKIFKGLSLKDFSFNFRLFLFLSAVFSLGSFSYSFLLIYVGSRSLETPFLPLFTIQILLYLLFTVVASIASLPFGWLADKMGRKTVLLFSFVFWAVVCFGFPYATSLITFAALFALYGLHKGAIEPSQKALVSELSPTQYRASTLGAFQMTTGLFALPASFVAGLLWVTVSNFAPFYLSLVLTATASLLLLFVKESSRSSK
ncbi:MAG TPA: MFS transporter [Candidatus Bathyarchaeia archaeon]|nr:MFS transporter [Candidatus Bathyarchaeia archaeon]